MDLGSDPTSTFWGLAIAVALTAFAWCASSAGRGCLFGA